MYPKLSAFDLTDNDANNCYIIQIWDLADTERKGFLSKQVKKKHDRVYLLSEELGLYSADFFFFFFTLSSFQQFFVALRLIACAQNGLEVALKSLNVAVPPPKFVSCLFQTHD